MTNRNTRHEAFQRTGGGPTWEYIAFITAAKRFAAQHHLGVAPIAGLSRYYSEPQLIVTDHAAFDLACDIYAMTLTNP